MDKSLSQFRVQKVAPPTSMNVAAAARVQRQHSARPRQVAEMDPEKGSKDRPAESYGNRNICLNCHMAGRKVRDISPSMISSVLF
jgi:hypothetical protein